MGDADLAEACPSPAEIALLRTCGGEDERLSLDLDEETFGPVVDLLEVTPKERRTPALDGSATAEARVRDAIVRFGAITGISPMFTPEADRRIAAAPQEQAHRWGLGH